MEAYPAAQTELRTALKTSFPGPEPPTHAQIIDAEVPYLDAVCEDVGCYWSLVWTHIPVGSTYVPISRLYKGYGLRLYP